MAPYGITAKLMAIQVAALLDRDRAETALVDLRIPDDTHERMRTRDEYHAATANFNFAFNLLLQRVDTLPGEQLAKIELLYTHMLGRYHPLHPRYPRDTVSLQAAAAPAP